MDKNKYLDRLPTVDGYTNSDKTRPFIFNMEGLRRKATEIRSSIYRFNSNLSRMLSQIDTKTYIGSVHCEHMNLRRENAKRVVTGVS